MEKLIFENLPFKFRADGVQAIVKFDNGFGASIVQNFYSYGNREGLYEIAILDKNGDITYDTKITNDVIGYLTPDDVINVLEEIRNLNANQ